MAGAGVHVVVNLLCLPCWQSPCLGSLRPSSSGFCTFLHAVQCLQWAQQQHIAQQYISTCESCWSTTRLTTVPLLRQPRMAGITHAGPVLSALLYALSAGGKIGVDACGTTKVSAQQALNYFCIVAASTSGQVQTYSTSYCTPFGLLHSTLPWRWLQSHSLLKSCCTLCRSIAAVAGALAVASARKCPCSRCVI